MPTHTLSIKQKTNEQYQSLLNGDVPNQMDSVVRTFTYKFDDAFEADIKVVAVPDEERSDGIHRGQSYIDPVLFQNGHEVCTSEPAYSLLGVYVFEHEDKQFVLNVVEQP